MKILAHLNDAVGKVYGVQHSGRVRGLGGNVFPSNAFGMPRIQLVMRILVALVVCLINVLET